MMLSTVMSTLYWKAKSTVKVQPTLVSSALCILIKRVNSLTSFIYFQVSKAQAVTPSDAPHFTYGLCHDCECLRPFSMLCTKGGNETATEKLLLKFSFPSSMYWKKFLQEEKPFLPYSLWDGVWLVYEKNSMLWIT